MPANSKDAWGEVGSRLSALGLKLQLHAQEELSDEAVRADAKDVATAVRTAVEATARELRERATPK